MSETASNTSSNIAYNNAFTSGPVRTGIFATSSTGRATSGSGYYGNMELSGNLWERVVTVGNATGRTFSGAHGNGTLNSSGDADVSGWPAAAGTGWKGGSWLNTTTNSATTSDRAQAANTDNTRAADAGGRGVRTITSGIVTDGLVLWLDAGISPSYAGSGTTWTDISGNRINGTLTNGPTFNSANGGHLNFNGTSQYGTFSPSAIFNFGTGDVTLEAWIYWDGTYVNTGRTLYATGGSGSLDQFGIYSGSTGLYFGGVGSYPNFPSVNQWCHILASKIGTTINIYINANLAGTGSQISSIGSSTATPSIAYRIADGQHPWSRRIATFRLYKGRGLTASEVTQNFNAQKVRFGL
jgi:hypothetical protein